MVVEVIAVVISVDVWLLMAEIVVDSIDDVVVGVAAAVDIVVGAVAAVDALPVCVITNVGGIVQSFQIYYQEVLINPARPSAT